jgi:hypothetical protein
MHFQHITPFHSGGYIDGKNGVGIKQPEEYIIASSIFLFVG